MTAAQPPGAVRIVVIADTHLSTPGPVAGAAGAGTTRSRRPRRDLPAALWEHLEGCDAILHAGDILDAGVLRRLEGAAPVHAVLGNNDRSLVGVLPETLELELGGVRLAMIHDSGATAGRPARVRRRFPEADVVIFGHSHAPCDELGVDGQRLFNPGSATQRRAQPVHTIGELHCGDGRLVGHRIIPLDAPGPAPG